jgi:hypothetical protein
MELRRFVALPFGIEPNTIPIESSGRKERVPLLATSPKYAGRREYPLRVKRIRPQPEQISSALDPTTDTLRKSITRF